MQQLKSFTLIIYTTHMLNILFHKKKKTLSIFNFTNDDTQQISIWIMFNCLKGLKLFQDIKLAPNHMLLYVRRLLAKPSKECCKMLVYIIS